MKSATVPEVAIVSPAQDYTDLDGNLVKAEEMDLCVRSISVGQVRSQGLPDHRGCGNRFWRLRG